MAETRRQTLHISLARTISSGPESSSIVVQEILELYTEAFQCLTAPPFTRIEALHYALDLLVDGEQWDRASRVAEQTLELFPVVSFRTGARDDKEDMVSYLSGLAANLCPLSLQPGDDASVALQRLELGRGIIMSTELDFRSDKAKLQEQSLALFHEFNHLRHVLGAEGDLNGVFSARTADLQIQAGLRAAEDLPNVLAKIRSLRGFERFQQSPTAAELVKEVQGHDQIVVFNCKRIRNEAVRMVFKLEGGKKQDH